MEYPTARIWVEMEENLIPTDIENYIRTSTPKLSTIKSYFLRIPINLADDYEFSVFTAGWQHLPYRIYLEVQIDPCIDIFPDDNPGLLYESINCIKLGLLTPNDVCFINGSKYCLKKKYSNQSSLWETYYFKPYRR